MIELAQQDRERIDTLIDLLHLNQEVLISCTEAARLLGRTTPTISKMLKDGRLHKTTIGDSTGIRLSEVLAKR